MNGETTSNGNVAGDHPTERQVPEDAGSDVRFIGEGVLVGKSALKSGNGKKLKISFDDNAICYEYPSEQVILGGNP